MPKYHIMMSVIVFFVTHREKILRECEENKQNGYICRENVLISSMSVAFERERPLTQRMLHGIQQV